MVELLTATLALCRQLADKDASHAADCAVAAIQALSKAEPVLASEPPTDWKKDLDLAQELVRKAHDQKVTRPDLYESLVSLLAREAYIEGKRGNKERRAELNKQALQWVENGLRLGQEAKLPSDRLLALNMLAAEMKTVAGGKAESIAENLNALKEVKAPPRARSSPWWRRPPPNATAGSPRCANCWNRLLPPTNRSWPFERTWCSAAFTWRWGSPTRRWSVCSRWRRRTRSSIACRRKRSPGRWNSFAAQKTWPCSW